MGQSSSQKGKSNVSERGKWMHVLSVYSKHGSIRTRSDVIKMNIGTDIECSKKGINIKNALCNIEV